MCDISRIESYLREIVTRYQPSIQPIHLFFSYYHDAVPERTAEIDLCLLMNTLNPLFTKIFIFNETRHPLELVTPSDRITVIESSRLTFNRFFKFANTQTTEETINIVINTDIVIGENFDQLKLERNQAICLSRHDFKENGTVEIAVGGGSHDCWIWKGHISENLGRFYMGKFLCDGVLAHELSTCGYSLKNPVHGLMIYHIHMSNIRNYGNHDRALGHRNGVNFSQHDGVFKPEDVYYEGLNIY